MRGVFELSDHPVWITSNDLAILAIAHFYAYYAERRAKL